MGIIPKNRIREIRDIEKDMIDETDLVVIGVWSKGTGHIIRHGRKMIPMIIKREKFEQILSDIYGDNVYSETEKHPAIIYYCDNIREELDKLEKTEDENTDRHND